MDAKRYNKRIFTVKKESGNREPHLYDKLKNYSCENFYPFHMPGHKRQLSLGPAVHFPNPYSLDITEIDGFDNLHHAEGIIRNSMEWAASVYGADKNVLPGQWEQRRDLKHCQRHGRYVGDDSYEPQLS